MPTLTADEIITSLELQPLEIEGGFFRETYRAPVAARTDPPRVCATLIYYMLRGQGRSAWHKVASDEIWLYHAGTPAIQLLLFPDGHWEERHIGPDMLAGETPQSLIPAGTWQAAVLADSAQDSWGLFGALVAPGFEYADFTSSDAPALMRAYPSALARMQALGLDV
jgi:uncharacterized protein